jgi:hypothetical protein
MIFGEMYITIQRPLNIVSECLAHLFRLPSPGFDFSSGGPTCIKEYLDLRVMR